MSNLSESGIETLALDVTIPESILALKDEVAKRTGGTLDILYNNAGTSKSHSSRKPIKFVFASPAIAKS